MTMEKKEMNKIKNYLSSRRTTKDDLLIHQGSNIRYKYKRRSLPSDIGVLDIDIIKIIDKIKADIEEMKSGLKFKKDKTAQGHRASKAKASSSPALSQIMLRRRLQ